MIEYKTGSWLKKMRKLLPGQKFQIGLFSWNGQVPVCIFSDLGLGASRFRVQLSVGLGTWVLIVSKLHLAGFSTQWNDHYSLLLLCVYMHVLYFES